MIEYHKEDENTSFETIKKLKNSYQNYVSKMNQQVGIAFGFVIFAHVFFSSIVFHFIDVDTVERIGLTTLSTFILIFVGGALIDNSLELKKSLIALDKKINPFHKDVIDNTNYFSNSDTRLSILQEMDDILAEAKKHDFLKEDVDLINSKKAKYLLLEDNHSSLWKESCEVIEIIINMKEKIQTLKNNSIYRQYEKQTSKTATFDKRGIL